MTKKDEMLPSEALALLQQLSVLNSKLETIEDLVYNVNEKVIKVDKKIDEVLEKEASHSKKKITRWLRNSKK